MRLLQVSRAPTGHDRRFADAWRSVGVTVSLAHVGDTDEEAARDTLRRAIADAGPDVIQAGPLSDVAPAVAEAWDGPLIAVSWGFDLMDEAKDPAVRDRITAALARADHILVDNDGPQRVALTLGAAPDRITKIPWGVDLATFRPGPSGLRSDLGWTSNDFVVVSTRRHEPIYDVETTARGFAAAAATIPRLRGLFCGGGTRTRGLQRILQAAGVQDRCRFLGEVPPGRLPEIYRAADVYVSSSLVDGSSVSLLEAMACGVPVCVSAIEGNTEWIAAGRGESFPVGDPTELADALRRLEQNPGHAARMARDALAHVRAQADWSTAGERLLAVARRAIRVGNG